jgi:spore coat-associated protein N
VVSTRGAPAKAEELTVEAVPAARALGKMRKLLLSVGAVGAAASIAGLGTFADFNDSTSASQQVSSGTLTLALGTSGTPANRLTVAASGLAPGDSIQRAATLQYGGTIDIAAVTLTTTASVSSLLDTDAANGLRMKIERCGGAGWVEAGTAPAYTYTCGGSVQSVLGERPVVGSDLALANLTRSAGTSDSLRITLTLPATADNTFQNRTSTILYTFTGTQRPGIDR